MPDSNQLEETQKDKNIKTKGKNRYFTVPKWEKRYDIEKFNKDEDDFSEFFYQYALFEKDKSTDLPKILLFDKDYSDPLQEMTEKS